MKLKFFFVCFLSCLWTTNSWAVDNGWRTIKSHGEVRCGTNLNAKTYAYKDENGYWHGIDADICRVLSAAIFGRTDKFKLVDVKPYQINDALLQNKIDVMLGETPGTASSDIENPITQAALLYYTRQMFLAHKNNNATSMKDFKGKKICIVPDNTDYFVFQNYNDKYGLDLKTLYFKDEARAKEAFLLKRCDLYTGNELYLKNIVKQMNNANIQIELLPEVIAENPIYIQVLSSNVKLAKSIKWIVNALRLAEEQDISSQNVNIFIGINDTSLKNLLGYTPDLWEKFELNPSWVPLVLRELGNYGEIYEKNLGNLSEFQIERGKNNLIKNGGLLGSENFY